LGARVMEERLAIQCLEVFLKTNFDGGRHARRVDLIDSTNKSKV